MSDPYSFETDASYFSGYMSSQSAPKSFATTTEASRPTKPNIRTLGDKVETRGHYGFNSSKVYRQDLLKPKDRMKHEVSYSNDQGPINSLQSIVDGRTQAEFGIQSAKQCSMSTSSSKQVWHLEKPARFQASVQHIYQDGGALNPRVELPMQDVSSLPDRSSFCKTGDPPNKRREYLAPEVLSEVAKRGMQYCIHPPKEQNNSPSCHLSITLGYRKKRWAQHFRQTKLKEIVGIQRDSDIDRLTSCMMFVVGFDREVFQLHELSNLFTLYGDVSYALDYREADIVVLGMGSIEAIEKSRRYLHKRTLNKSQIFLHRFADFEGLDPCYLYCQPEVFVPRSSYRRFKQDMLEMSIGVSRALQFFVTTNDDRVFSDDAFFEFVSSLEARPNEVRRVIAPDKPNMWFAKYNRREKAIMVLMKLQGLPCKGGIVRISFTKSKVFMKNRPGGNPTTVSVPVDLKLGQLAEEEESESEPENAPKKSAKKAKQQIV